MTEVPPDLVDLARGSAEILQKEKKWRAEENSRNSGDKRRKGSDETFSPLISTFPSALGENAYCGLAGEVVHAITPHTEADPAALMISVLTMFGNEVGRGPHFMLGDAEHPTNLFALIVGETDSGRKGTATESPRRLIGGVDSSWLKCVVSGLESGQGVIHHVRDPRTERRRARKGEEADEHGMLEELVDAGTDEKRLMVLESEFAKLLAATGRRDSTLSAVLRDAWDARTLRSLSKNSPEIATNAHVSVLAQITPMELQSRLDSVEIANGFMNRFVIVASERSKFLPRGGNVPGAVQIELNDRLTVALAKARSHSEVGMSEAAWLKWDEVYEHKLAKRPPGLVGALTARAAPIVRRFALIYALLDGCAVVDIAHLEAALEMWRYAEGSARWVFGDRFGDWIVDDCWQHLREAGKDGLTRTELRDLLGHRIPSARITNALRLLASLDLAEMKKEPTDGRPIERWYPKEKKE